VLDQVRPASEEFEALAVDFDLFDHGMLLTFG
jgi:hypothetical protein